MLTEKGEIQIFNADRRTVVLRTMSAEEPKLAEVSAIFRADAFLARAALPRLRNP